MGKPMKSGKYCPHMFESNGKLYILSRFFFGATICLFEEYDPVKDCWTVLHTHPSFDFEWCGTSVLNSGKVLTLGSFGESFFSFDPDTHMWSELIKLRTNNLHSISFFVEDNFYEVRGGFKTELAKLGPFSSFKDGQHDYFCCWAPVDAKFTRDIMVC